MKKTIALLSLSLLFWACTKIEETTYIAFRAGFVAPQVVRVGEAVIFKADASTTGAQTFLWKFGDKKRQTSNEVNPVFVYDTIGEYTATMVVEMDKKNSIKRDSVKQKVFSLPPTYDYSSNLYTQENYVAGFGTDEIAMSFARTTEGGFAIVAQQNLNTLYVAKIKPNLDSENPDWAFAISDFGASPIYPAGIIQTADNGFLVVGYMEIGASDSDAFVIKLNSNGIEQWRNTSLNSTNYERYTDVIQLANGDFIATGSIGKTSNTAVPILHTFDADGDYLTQAEVSTYKNCHINQIKKFGATGDVYLVGNYAQQPVVISFYNNLVFKGISKINISGEAFHIAKTSGGDLFVTGRGYQNGSTAFQDSTSYAFLAKFNDINGTPQSWLSRTKMYRERYIHSFALDLNNIICVGEHYNPLSGKDLLFTKVNAQNGVSKSVKLLGDESDHRIAKVYFDGTHIYAFATTREFISDKNSRYDICIVKTKLTDILP